jgi:hypothetical protein
MRRQRSASRTQPHGCRCLEGPVKQWQTAAVSFPTTAQPIAYTWSGRMPWTPGSYSPADAAHRARAARNCRNLDQQPYRRQHFS